MQKAGVRDTLVEGIEAGDLKQLANAPFGHGERPDLILIMV